MRRIIAMIIAAILMLPNIVFAEGELSPYMENLLPCMVQAANFDYGGAGVAFSPLSGGLDDGTFNYREDAELNFYKQSSGVVLSYKSGSWMKYTIKVKKAGNFEVLVGYATPNGGGIDVVFDEKTKLSVSLPTTQSWSDIKHQSAGTIYLTEGEHIVKTLATASFTFKELVFEEVSAQGDSDSFARKDGPYRNIFIPALIQAEDFDMGAEGSFSSDGKNAGKLYRKDDGIDIMSESDSKYYIRLSKSEFTRYTFNVENAGAYRLTAAGNGTINAYFDDLENPVSAKCEGMENETEMISVWLSKGEHTLTVKTDSGLSLDYLRFQSVKDNYTTLDALKEGIESSDEDTFERTKIYKEFYVSPYGDDLADGTKESPFLTINAARDAVREVSDDMDGDVVVNILPGNYDIDEQIVFDERDGGKNGYNIIYKGTSVIDAPVINGGTKITGWQPETEYIWSAPAPIEDTRNLYINGLPAQRAKGKYIYDPETFYQNEGSPYEYDEIRLSKVNFPTSLTNPEDVELVWNIFWTCQRMPVKDVVYDGTQVRLIMDQPAFHNMMTKIYDYTKVSLNYNFYIENALELLDEPGEFYFDKVNKKMYYYPFASEDLTTAEVYAGTTEFMVRAAGSSLENKLTNIVFDNIDFRYGAWNAVSEEGITGAQADKIQVGAYEGVLGGGRIIPAQFTVENAKNVVIKNCKFKSLGSGAISMANAVQDSEIIGNVFTDNAGSSIIIGHWDHVNKMPKGMERCVNIEVANNVIRRAAYEFRGSCGISMYYVNSINVHHNDIKDITYSGMTIGWGWGVDIPECANNTIAYNKIENVCMTTPDGGHIYTLGPMRNSYLIGNYMVKSGDNRGGIYHDQGSQYITTRDHVIEQCDRWLIARPNAGMRENHLDNIFVDIDERSQDPDNVTVENVTVVPDGNWPEEAQKIIDAAGLEDGYERLLSGVEYPEWREMVTYRIPRDYFESDINGWIQAENYDAGGEGVGFHKLNGGEVVTFEHGTMNCVVGDTKPGEWLQYSINLRDSGLYTLQLKTANNFKESDPQPLANVYIDGELIVKEAPIFHNGDWQIHVPANYGEHQIEAGEHTVRIEFANNGFSFDSWRFFLAEAANDENFDEGKIVLEGENEEKGFVDISGHWAETTIKELYDEGIIKGMSETEFAPDNDTTLYQAIWLAMRGAKISYTDENWKEIAGKYGLLADINEKDSAVSRQRFAEIVMKAYTAKKGKYTIVWDEAAFKDFARISNDKVNAVLGAKNLSLMIGDENGNFCPEKNLTRAEVAVVISKLLALL